MPTSVFEGGEEEQPHGAWLVYLFKAGRIDPGCCCLETGVEDPLPGATDRLVSCRRTRALELPDRRQNNLCGGHDGGRTEIEFVTTKAAWPWALVTALGLSTVPRLVVTATV